MTQINGVLLPAFGTLQEIHTEIFKTLSGFGEQCTINGWEYTITSSGFRSHDSNKDYPVSAIEGIHPGIAVLLAPECGKYCMQGRWEIVTLGKIPHVSKRCPKCGDQLNAYEIEHYGACTSCYSGAVSD